MNPKPTGLVFLIRRGKFKHINTQSRIPCEDKDTREDGSRDWSDTATSQGMAGPPELEVKEEPHLELSEATCH